MHNDPQDREPPDRVDPQDRVNPQDSAAPLGPGATDRETTVRQLRELVAAFVAERDWRQFHAPKNLAMSLAIEAAELMEHFQWLSVDASRTWGHEDPQRLTAIGEELADVLCYALALANELELDISSVVYDKMQKNARKYPADEYRGRYGAEDR